MPSQNIFTFYLKHQKYPFCAPIFHPLSETESDPGKARGCSTNTSVTDSVMVCENIFTAPPRPNDCRWCFQSSNRLCYNFLEIINPEGHQNRIGGSKVTTILRKGWILHIGGVASGRVCACSLRSRLVHRLCCAVFPSGL